VPAACYRQSEGESMREWTMLDSRLPAGAGRTRSGMRLQSTSTSPGKRKKFCVCCSADLLPNSTPSKRLVAPLADLEVGTLGPSCFPSMIPSSHGLAPPMLWELHHKITLDQFPSAGEMTAVTVRIFTHSPYIPLWTKASIEPGRSRVRAIASSNVLPRYV